MPPQDLTQPLAFEPIFKERIWGGRRLELEYGKNLPPAVLIGESWEIVDRPEAQSVVHDGPLRGRTLHDLWTKHRAEVFGDVPDAPRFPVFVKMLDAQAKLSLQVHPPRDVAAALGGEEKSELWYFAAADPTAEIFVGLRKGTDRARFEEAVRAGRADDHVHRIRIKAGDAMFLPSGRLHAIGGGNVIVEIQQNSDTTYRVFDWNRKDRGGSPRQLHIEQSMRSIDFADYEPSLIEARGERLIEHSLFNVEKWELTTKREAAPPGQFAIACCLSGDVECSGATFTRGEFFLIPATLRDRDLRPTGDATSLLRVTLRAR